jgi:phage terminase large subunit-like protein
VSDKRPGIAREDVSPPTDATRRAKVALSDVLAEIEAEIAEVDQGLEVVRSIIANRNAAMQTAINRKNRLLSMRDRILTLTGELPNG